MISIDTGYKNMLAFVFFNLNYGNDVNFLLHVGTFVMRFSFRQEFVMRCLTVSFRNY